MDRAAATGLPRCDENPRWGYRRVHGELLVLGVKVAASTVWEILHEAGIDPAPERSSATWADFLRSQAEALLACDFFETVTVCGARLYVLAGTDELFGQGQRRPFPTAGSCSAASSGEPGPIAATRRVLVGPATPMASSSRRVQTSSCAARSSSTMRTILPRVCPSLTLRCARAAFRQKYLLDT
jgi:hypothetical protein